MDMMNDDARETERLVKEFLFAVNLEGDYMMASTTDGVDMAEHFNNG